MRNIARTSALFLILFIALRHLLPTGVLLYQGILLGVVLSLLQAALEIRHKSPLMVATKDAILAFLLIYAFVFTVPTTVDRSYSVHMINRLAAVDDGLGKDEIKRGYVSYFVDEGGVEKRLKEQLVSRTIRQEGPRYVLTDAGRVLSRAFLVTAMLFKCRTD